MELAQLQALKAYIDADPVLSAIPNTNDGAYQVRDALNALASPTYTVWKTNASVDDIFDAIDFAKYTPTDVADGTALFTNRLLSIQTKQMNLQNMLVGRQTVNASKQNVRAGLRDAVNQLPSGVGGALVSAGGPGGATVLTSLVRPARLVEKILVSGTAQTGTVTAGIMGFEGAISTTDVSDARSL